MTSIKSRKPHSKDIILARRIKHYISKGLSEKDAKIKAKEKPILNLDIQQTKIAISTYVTNHGGKIVSDIDDFIKLTDKVLIDCGKGHELLFRTPRDILSCNSWCKKCRLNQPDKKIGKPKKPEEILQRRITKYIKDGLSEELAIETANQKKILFLDIPQTKLAIEEYVDKMQGKIVSDLADFKKLKQKIKIECKFGHSMEINPREMISKLMWCNVCKSRSRIEHTIRLIVEASTGEKFPSIRPEFLKSKKGRRLEIDGFSNALNIGFEYQGGQHYRPNIYSNDFTTFNEIKERDALKLELSKNAGIKLVVIPEYRKPFDLYDIFEHTFTAFKDNGITLHKPNLQLIDISEIYCDNHHFKSIEEVVTKKKGKIISTHYTGESIKMEFECTNLHRFKMKKSGIISGRWCSHCSAYTSEEIFRILLETSTGEIFPRHRILSINRKNTIHCYNTKLKIGFMYNKPIENVMLNNYIVENNIKIINIPKYNDIKNIKEMFKHLNICFDSTLQIPDFSKIILTEEMRKEHYFNHLKNIATNYGGELLSTAYSSNKDFIILKCKCGNKWCEKTDYIFGGSWCKFCR